MLATARRHASKPRYAIALMFALAAPFFGLPARAADKLGNSLDFVPAKVSVYASVLRLREQWDLAANSRAWQRFKEIPAVGQALQMLDLQLQSPQAALMLQNPQVADLSAFGADLISHEIFLYASDDLPQFLKLVGEITGQLQGDAANALGGGSSSRGGGRQGRAGDDSTRRILQALAARPDKVAAPDMLLGFKVADAARAVAQLKVIEAYTNLLVFGVPQLAGRIAREKIGENEFLTVKLDGKLFPPQHLDFGKFEKTPGEFDAVKQKILDLRLVVSLGIRDGYFLVSIGETNEQLAMLGQGPLLVDRSEMQPLLRHAGERVTGIGFLSREMAAAAAFSGGDFDSLVAQVQQAMPNQDLPPELKERLLSDLNALANDIKKHMPEPGASASIGFLTPRGFEEFRYDYSKGRALDASRPLSIARHLGGNPLAAFATRSKYDQADYQAFVGWLKKGYGYFEDFGLPQMSDDEQRQYRQIFDLAKPLLERLDAATGQMLLPALADSQAAFVLDAKISSPQWHPEMPPSQTSLPMAELALVLGVSDAELLKQGVAEYGAIVRDAFDLARKIDPNAQLPADLLPAPQSRSVEGGSLYVYNLPAEARLDPQIAPTAGLANGYAVLSTSPAQAERVLKPTPLALAGPLGDLDKARGAIAYCDMAQLIDALVPWIDYGGRIAAAEQGLDPAAADAILGQVQQGVQLLKVFRSHQSETYEAEGALVTHGETHIQDVE